MYREVGNLNPYALDYPVCVEDQGTNAGRARKYGRGQRNWMINHMLPTLFTQFLVAEEGDNAQLNPDSAFRLEEIKKLVSVQTPEEYVPCAEDYMTSYLNQPDVKKALHVNPDIAWKDCSTTLRYQLIYFVINNSCNRVDTLSFLQV